MESFDVFQQHWFLRRNNIMDSFEGALSQEILVSLAEMIKQRVYDDKHLETFARKVFGIFVELAQNIQRYSSETETFDGKEIGTGSLIAFNTDKFYTITSCNKIKNSRIEFMKERCKHINSLDKEGLKAFYKETLRKSEMEKSPTGGVGLIEMTRKSGLPLKFNFIEIDNESSHFIITIDIEKEEKT